MKKICHGCNKEFKVKASQYAKLFCSEACKYKSYKRLEDTEKYLERQKQVKLKEYELIQYDLDLCEMKKRLIVLRENIGWSKIKEPKQIDLAL